LTNFSELGLDEPLLKALAAEGYDTPTPIQAQAIPHVLRGRDVVGAAQTGTGKTAAFALPLLQRLNANPKRAERNSCRALILSPTRELAAQIEEAIRTYGRFYKMTTAAIFGGVGFGPQRRAIHAGLDILVATPGRLLDLVDDGTLRLDRVEVLILDEADRMLDLGFIHALRRVAQLVPKNRQSLFFSATMPKPIRELASRFLTDPIEISVTPVASAAETVSQKVIMTKNERKPALLAHVLTNADTGRTIVFTRTKHGADKVVKSLDRAGIDSAAIHGNKSQAQRERALDGFRAGHIPVLVATDIAARGIDVDGVGLVVNYDLPNVAESYVHRIGRTGRAGADGRAIAFCTPDEASYLTDIERLMRRRVERMHEPEDVAYLPPAENDRMPVREGAERAPRADRPAGARPGGDRFERNGRSHGGRGGFGQRNGEGGDRPSRGPSRPRGERPAFARDGEAPARPREDGASAQPRAERPARTDRPAHADRPARTDRPARAERPNGGADGHRGPRAQAGERPRSDRPQGDRPAGDRPRGDRPRNDRPRTDRPRHEAPAGDGPVRFAAEREPRAKRGEDVNFGDLVKMIAVEEDARRKGPRQTARR
jgi:ATP-dependent RNA helicase RhlE